jgi:hypothetical protein
VKPIVGCEGTPVIGNATVEHWRRGGTGALLVVSVTATGLAALTLYRGRFDTRYLGPYFCPTPCS